MSPRIYESMIELLPVPECPVWETFMSLTGDDRIESGLPVYVDIEKVGLLCLAPPLWPMLESRTCRGL